MTTTMTTTTTTMMMMMMMMMTMTIIMTLRLYGTCITRRGSELCTDKMKLKGNKDIKGPKSCVGVVFGFARLAPAGFAPGLHLRTVVIS